MSSILISLAGKERRRQPGLKNPTGTPPSGRASDPRTGRRVTSAPVETIVLAYNKPVGLITTHDDELGRKTVAPASCGRKRHKWHAIGRLDADTDGLLLLTNDGALVHHATHPSSKVPKTYMALCRGILQEEQIQQLREGVELTGGLGTSLPAEIVVEGFEENATLLRITICEGKNRQIRRMLLAINSQVLTLTRLSIGDISIENIDSGR
ncbi:hypothetical protein GUITHDRAFT_132155 [Guillardia theta CCMP2712]|uniref:Pseudouridine synthase RsuA/RluA-like domain-containing protein n=1 Tax=Guillardia theta (strain CCMP2712) TaxID=905079 RepID=L1K1T9_GUITC|nr:hypothetical protein GUITHDRAFT_132155 [Guillardia theta CCMP2712]EKX54420.1 hypothetical protein GUITHDRAFT_132155 [Guillardia theta CCMP2712]|eukprot:XP_005841400.1 hypothetical protein GUITHDRAFT_132155 [Guillardia theta CCMP2712]